MRSTSSHALVGAFLCSLVAFLGEPSAWAQSAAGFRCARLTGGSIGAVYAPGSWDRMGKSPWFASLSPTLAGSCALETPTVTGWIGIEANLTYAHYNSEATLDHGWITASAGVGVGNDTWRVGPHAVGLPGLVGAGVTGTWLPGDPHRGRAADQYGATRRMRASAGPRPGHHFGADAARIADHHPDQGGACFWDAVRPRCRGWSSQGIAAK